MPQFILKINLGNEGIQTGNDIAKALHIASIQINSNDTPIHTTRNIRDRNGNTVGSWQVK